jgi:hypothetical protein
MAANAFSPILILQFRFPPVDNFYVEKILRSPSKARMGDFNGQSFHDEVK